MIRHEDCGNYELGKQMRNGWCYPCWKKAHGGQIAQNVDGEAPGCKGCLQGAEPRAIISFAGDPPAMLKASPPPR